MSTENPLNHDSDFRDARIGAVLNEIFDREARGEPATPKEIRARFPDIADDLLDHLRVLRELTPAVTIRALCAAGILSPADGGDFPATLGDFGVIEVIGRGGMGVVLRAVDLTLKRPVALKILRTDVAADPIARERFRREAQAAAALQHPNIVTVYVVGDTNDVPYLAMELINGPTLANVVNKYGPLAPHHARQITREILSGLREAHNFGLIHRDVKSANVLLDGLRSDADPESAEPQLSDSHHSDAAARDWSQVTAKLADFGLARLAEGQTTLTQVNAVVGTPEYMSPEQARGERVDARTDLYSLGVVLYEMLTGRAPFKTTSSSATIHRLLYENPALPRIASGNSDDSLSRFALRLLAKRPEDRFASAADALTALDETTSISLPERARQRRRRLVIGGGIVAAAALFFALVWYTLLQPPRLLEVKTDPHNPATVLAYFSGRTQPRVIHTFPPAAGRILRADVVDPDGNGPKWIVAGTERPLNGRNLFAFDVSGNELWSTDLTCDLQWPDCSSPTEWKCEQISVEDIDGIPGDELLAASKDGFEYPSRLSLIDVKTGAVKSTLWHYGHFSKIYIARDFFGPGLSAIVVTALNNKLDGFDEPRDDDDSPIVHWNIVSVVMILDPRDFDGLAPPRSARMPELKPAPIYAYAALDRAAIKGIGWTGPPAEKPTAAHELRRACAEDILSAPYSNANGGQAACFTITLGTSDDATGWGNLTFDRHLNIVHLVVSTGQTDATSPDYWRKYWRPIIQDGKYVSR